MLDEDQYFAKCESAIMAMADAGLAVFPDISVKDAEMPNYAILHTLEEALEAAGFTLVSWDP